jgi:hypothetical protein
LQPLQRLITYETQVQIVLVLDSGVEQRDGGACHKEHATHAEQDDRQHLVQTCILVRVGFAVRDKVVVGRGLWLVVGACGM